jgi:hypothetical protein
MAFAGFYHDPTEESDSIECFSCGTIFQLTSDHDQREHSTLAEQLGLLKYHTDNCHWAEMLRELLTMNIVDLQRNSTTEEIREEYGEKENISKQMDHDRSSESLLRLRVDRTGKMTFKNGPFSLVYDS